MKTKHLSRCHAGSSAISGECLTAPCGASLAGNSTTFVLMAKERLEASTVLKKSVSSNKQHGFYKHHPQKCLVGAVGVADLEAAMRPKEPPYVNQCSKAWYFSGQEMTI